MELATKQHHRNLVKKMLVDLRSIGFSYARISARIGISPSGVQKISYFGRTPHASTIRGLALYYQQIFSNHQQYTPNISSFYCRNRGSIEKTLRQLQGLQV
jgi:hypothetical protein